MTGPELLLLLARLEAAHGPRAAREGLRACRIAIARVAAEAAARRHPAPERARTSNVIRFPLHRRLRGAGPDRSEE